MEKKIDDSVDEAIIVSGRDKPTDVPGRKWFPVKNNPFKPQQTTAWRLGNPATGEPLPKDGTGEETRVEGRPGDPPVFAGRTPEDIKRSRQTSRVISGVEQSLPIGDRD